MFRIEYRCNCMRDGTPPPLQGWYLSETSDTGAGMFETLGEARAALPDHLDLEQRDGQPSAPVIVATQIARAEADPAAWEWDIDQDDWPYVFVEV